MAKLKILDSPTISLINSRTEEQTQDWRRAHLGASGIGDPCDRALWYGFRWFTAPDFPGRILRLFRRGQNEEATIVADLRMAGVTVSEGPTEGEQWRFSALGGHYGGSMDAAIFGLLEAPLTWHVGEFKTHNRKSFDLLLKEGVQKSKEKHYAQQQAYMHRFKLTRAVYIAVCKDTDRYFLERIPYDRFFADELEAKAERIVFAEEPPKKLSERPDYYICKWCTHYDVCHQEEETKERNCRTCKFSRAVLPELLLEKGGWICTRYAAPLSLDEQKNLAEDCPSYDARS